MYAVVLHNVRSAHNVGSIFRTADAAGISRVFLTGYTPLPLDRFMRPNKEIAKTALAAERFIEWEHVKVPAPLVRRLKREGWKIVGVEQDQRAVNYRDFVAGEKIVFVFGNELRGLSRQLRDVCDELVEIPMRGKKESLNVAVSAGIILFTCTR